MKRIILFVVSVMVVSVSFAEEKNDTTYWTNGGMVSVNFNQISFANWAAGGMNSVSGVARAQCFAKYKKGNVAWDNILDIGYGLSKVQGLVVQKNEDIIDLQSKLGIKASKEWFYSGLLNFKSQFAPGYSDKENKNKISDLFSPAYLFLSFGMDFKPSDKFSLMLSPLTGKMTIVKDKLLRESFGVDSLKTTRSEFGAYLKTELNKEIVENVSLLSELGLFTNYLNHPERVDVDLKVGINMKINKYLSAQLSTQMIYDYDIHLVNEKAKIQFKELFGVGFSFKF